MGNPFFFENNIFFTFFFFFFMKSLFGIKKSKFEDILHMKCIFYYKQNLKMLFLTKKKRIYINFALLPRKLRETELFRFNSDSVGLRILNKPLKCCFDSLNNIKPNYEHLVQHFSLF